jgi:hypothetical protein
MQNSQFTTIPKKIIENDPYLIKLKKRTNEWKKKWEEIPIVKPIQGDKEMADALINTIQKNIGGSIYIETLEQHLISTRLKEVIKRSLEMDLNTKYYIVISDYAKDDQLKILSDFKEEYSNNNQFNFNVVNKDRFLLPYGGDYCSNCASDTICTKGDNNSNFIMAFPHQWNLSDSIDVHYGVELINNKYSKKLINHFLKNLQEIWLQSKQNRKDLRINKDKIKTGFEEEINSLYVDINSKRWLGTPKSKSSWILTTGGNAEFLLESLNEYHEVDKRISEKDWKWNVRHKILWEGEQAKL